MKFRTKLATALPLTLLAACGGGGGHSGAHHAALEYSDPFTVLMVDLSSALLVPSVEGLVSVWSIDPQLPDGLSFDLATGEISGTPHASSPRTLYTVHASSSAGELQTTIEITVEKPERYAYVTCTNDRSISILGIDATSGSLTRRGFVLVQPAQGHPESFLPNTHAPFGYSTTGEGVLTTWAIDQASGWLTEIDALVGDAGAHTLALSPDGRFLFVANQDAADVTVYRADSPDGLLQQVAPGQATPARPVALAIDGSGTSLAVACQGANLNGSESRLVLYTIDPLTGAVQPNGSGILLNGALASSCTFALRQDVLYVGLPEARRVVAFTYDAANGNLVSLGSAFSGAGCGALALDSMGEHLWSVNEAAGTLASFEVRPNGSLKDHDQFAVGSQPNALVIDPLGRFLYTLDSGTQELAVFDLESQTADASYRTGWQTRSAPVHISFGRGEHALVATSSELLVAGFGSSDVLTHPIDAADGSVGAGVSLPTGNGPLSVAVDPRQRFAFTGNTQEHSIGRYRIDAASGALTELQPALPTSGVPICVATDATGRFLYAAMREVSSATDGFVNSYAIDAASGELTLQGTIASGIQPNWLGIDPTGQFLYVANTGTGSAGSATIAVFRLASVTGLPTGPADVQDAAGVWSLGFHPSGRYVYAALRNTNSTLPLLISSVDGSLSAVGAGVACPQEPMSVVVAPDGRFAYVALRNSGGTGLIGRYSINQSTGALIGPASPFLDGVEPVDLVIDVTGHYLYGANSGTDSISAYTLDPSDGYLQPLTPAQTGLVPSALALLQRWQ